MAGIGCFLAYGKSQRGIPQMNYQAMGIAFFSQELFYGLPCVFGGNEIGKLFFDHDMPTFLYFKNICSLSLFLAGIIIPEGVFLRKNITGSL